MSDSRSNIVLIGMPGAGKSTVGVVLAKIVNKDFLDADLLIQKRYGKTLQTLIDELGSEGFIHLEDEVLQGVHAENTVIATGGSAIYSDEGMRHLAGIGKVVYLKIGLDSLTERLGDLQERGVVMKGDVATLAALFAERAPLYERYADVTIDVDGLDITTTAQSIRSNL